VKYLTFIFDLKKNCYIVEKKRQIANIVHNLRKNMQINFLLDFHLDMFL
jgi:hypothetical protein